MGRPVIFVLLPFAPIPTWLQRIEFDPVLPKQSARMGCSCVCWRIGGRYHVRPVFGHGPIYRIGGGDDERVAVRMDGQGGGVDNYASPLVPYWLQIALLGLIVGRLL